MFRSLSIKHFLLFTIFTITACATQTGWAPTIDTASDPNINRINQDMAECKELALQASGGTLQESAKGAGVGGLIGGAGGAAIGAITGSPGTGAAIGAAAGGIGGAAQQGLESETRFKNAYRNCLRQRGHQVIN
jgi:outer membrane lipoprotein SlyB